MTGRNSIVITAESLTVLPRGLDRLWGFRKSIVVQLSSVVHVGIERLPLRIATGWRGPGLDAFGKLVGTFHPRGERHYWNYSGSGPALTVRLDGSHYFHQLYLSVDSAEGAAELLSDAIAKASSAP